MAEGNDPYQTLREAYITGGPDFINISGRPEEPLWVERHEVAAIGVRGEHDSLVVLKGGMQLVAKSMHPNEVVGLVVGIDAPEGKEDLGWVG